MADVLYVTGRFTGEAPDGGTLELEALIRWDVAKDGSVTPAAFIDGQVVSHRRPPSTGTATHLHILRLMHEHGPMTDLQLRRYWRTAPGATDASPAGIRTRRRELVRAGLVCPTGATVKIPTTGRRAQSWTLTNTGRGMVAGQETTTGGTDDHR